MMNLRSRATGIATGDQGIFVERALFEQVGGFAAIPLMEDVALSKTLKRTAGRPACLALRVVTSGRRWEARGPWRTIVTMWRLRLAFALGADPAPARPRLPMTAPAAGIAPTLVVFAKEPTPGRVKTRLAAAIGAQSAADVYRELTAGTLAHAAAARDAGIVRAVELWCTPDADTPYFRQVAAVAGAQRHAQSGGDLGARMMHAISDVLTRRPRVLLIGTDCPVLDAQRHRRGRGRCSTTTTPCSAPPRTAGTYSSGRPVRCRSATCAGARPTRWRTRSAGFARAGIRYATTSALWDVDEPADLARWEALRRAATPTAR